MGTDAGIKVPRQLIKILDSLIRVPHQRNLYNRTIKISLLTLNNQI